MSQSFVCRYKGYLITKDRFGEFQVVLDLGGGIVEEIASQCGNVDEAKDTVDAQVSRPITEILAEI